MIPKLWNVVRSFSAHNYFVLVNVSLCMTTGDEAPSPQPEKPFLLGMSQTQLDVLAACFCGFCLDLGLFTKGIRYLSRNTVICTYSIPIL